MGSFHGAYVAHYNQKFIPAQPDQHIVRPGVGPQKGGEVEDQMIPLHITVLLIECFQIVQFKQINSGKRRMPQ